jgi:hypothetical protein
MRLIIALTVACLALTALKLAAVGLAILLIISVLWGAFAHPAETFGVLIFFVFGSAMSGHPVACLTFLGVIAACLGLRPGGSHSADPKDEIEAQEEGASNEPGKTP